MKQGRFSEQQIIGILKQNEAGLPVTQLCRDHGIGESTFYKWKIATRSCRSDCPANVSLT